MWLHARAITLPCASGRGGGDAIVASRGQSRGLGSASAGQLGRVRAAGAASRGTARPMAAHPRLVGLAAHPGPPGTAPAAASQDTTTNYKRPARQIIESTGNESYRDRNQTLTRKPRRSDRDGDLPASVHARQCARRGLGQRRNNHGLPLSGRPRSQRQGSAVAASGARARRTRRHWQLSPWLSPQRRRPVLPVPVTP